MGYRNYIGFLPKRDYLKIKSLTVQGICDYYKADNIYEVGSTKIITELYELGKYVDIDPPKESVKDFFKIKDVNKAWNEDGELCVVSKEFLEFIINSYRDKIKTYYNDMINPFLTNGSQRIFGEFLNSVDKNFRDDKINYKFDFLKITNEEQNSLYNIIEHVKSMRTEWTQLSPFELDGSEQITTSWKYEYAIFELIRIYKTFNWKKNVMVYYGY